jgi:hypothetical protein
VEAAARHFYKDALGIVSVLSPETRPGYIADIHEATRQGLAAYFAALDRGGLLALVAQVVHKRAFEDGDAYDDAKAILAALGLSSDDLEAAA